MKDRARNGFTLIELLVAISIFCVLIVTVYSSFMSGVSARQKGEQVVELAGTGLDILRRMSSELANCTTLEGYGFWGETDRLTFTTLKRGASGSVPRICQLSYYLDNEGHDGTLHLRRTSQTVGGPYSEGEIAGSCLKGLRFTYGYDEGDNGVVEWTGSWSGEDVKPLPLFVRVDLVLVSEGESMTLSRTVAIPVGRGLEVSGGLDAELQ
jgi:prepilin-type N-terminal cleavage/methylation domain-containing protein